ncbi:MAG: hypothetical protein N2319_04455 [Candidatus Kapabacteria bacterium]|nr:hypothetical protein [Candidatus Kapabacteria bacterium]
MANRITIIPCIIVCIFSVLTLPAQNYNPEQLEQLVERISSEENANISLDMIEYFILNPINLRVSSEKEIAEIPAISYDLAIRIKQLIKQNPDIKFSEIRDSLILSDDIFYLLTLTTYLGDEIEKKKKFKLDARARYQPLINQIKGFENSKFLGSPYDTYFRFRTNYEDIKAGLLLSKDIGEQSLTEFIAGYFKFKLMGIDITLGDFLIHSGMGNILWSQYSFGKGAETIYPAVSFNSNTSGYISSTESDFFRGASISFDLKLSKNFNIRNSAWFSSRKLSGTINNSNDTIISIYNLGLFRTESEIQKKNNLNETIIGFKSEMNSLNNIIGLSGFLYNYDKFINSDSRAVLHGQTGYLGSLYYLINLGKSRLLGEFSIDNNRKLALRAAFNKSFDNIEFVVNFRYFDENFRSPFGFNFGDSPEVNNETGIYTGIKWKLSKSIIISSYFDFFKTLARTFFIPFLKNGQDFFVQSDWNIDNSSNLRFRFNYESKTDNISDNKGNKNYIQKSKYYSRIEYQRKFSETFQIRLRSDFNFINMVDVKPNETGFAISLEMTYKPIPDLLFQGRITKFDTDSYESAIWQFECPVQGYMYSQVLYEQGWRGYFGVRYSITEFLSAAFRFSITSKNNVDNLGSGLNQILGNQDKKIIFQININF